MPKNQTELNFSNPSEFQTQLVDMSFLWAHPTHCNLNAASVPQHSARMLWVASSLVTYLLTFNNSLSWVVTSFTCNRSPISVRHNMRCTGALASKFLIILFIIGSWENVNIVFILSTSYVILVHIIVP
jgi:hypothetical protein